MAKKKLHGLDLLRWLVYVLLVLALGVFVYSFVWGLQNAKETALSGFQISADIKSPDIKCAEGEMVYGVHNYPYSSIPKESGAHSKYLDKMPSGNWKCSNICAPADVNKFTEVLSKLTVGGQKMNVVAGKAEFDALIAKSNGKNELLERTMILDVSLQRRGKGCFGPSEDYNSLSGAKLAKENTTAADQKKAEEERQKKAEEERRKKAEEERIKKTDEKVTDDTGSDDTKPSGGTAAGDPSGQNFQAPVGGSNISSTSEEEKAVQKCISDLKTLHQKANNYPDLQRDINLSIQAANIILKENISRPDELKVLAVSCKKTYDDYQTKFNSGISSGQAESQDHLVTLNIYGNVAFSPNQLGTDGSVAKNYGKTHICVAFNKDPKKTCKKISTQQRGGSFDISLSTTKKELEAMTNTGAGISFYAVNVGSITSGARNFLASYDFRGLGVPEKITNSVLQLQVSDKPIVLQGTRAAVKERTQYAINLFGFNCKDKQDSKTIR